MFKYLCLATGVFFVSSTAAQACSFHFPANFHFQYEILAQGKMDTRWAGRNRVGASSLSQTLSSLDIIFIARPAEDKILTELPDTWRTNHNDDREYRRIRWDVSRFIKGRSPTQLYLRYSNGKILPVLSQDTETIASNSRLNMSQSQARENLIKAIQERVTDRNSFPFWDAPVLKNSEVVDVTSYTSCGEISVPAFDFDRSYIVGIDNNGATAFAEPLADNVDDPLIKGLERIVTTGRFSPDISVEAFLTEMEFRDVVMIESCGLNLQNRNAISETWRPYDESYLDGAYSPNQFEYGQEIEFSRVGQSGETDVNITELSRNYPALLEYFDKDKSKVSCQPGEKFAVYGDTDLHEEPVNLLQSPNIPKYRFARIENGTVRVDDILTNYNLIGPSHISISEFRSPNTISSE